MSHDCRLVIVLRLDLRLGITNLINQAYYARMGTLDDVTPLELEEWIKNASETVVLSTVGEATLVQLEALASSLGINVYLVRDTQGIATAIGLGPSTGLDRVVGGLPLWQPSVGVDTYRVVH